MKAFRLGKSKKNSKGQLKKITTVQSNPSLHSSLKNQPYTSTLYGSLNRNTPNSSNANAMTLNSNAYTNFMTNGNSSMNVNRKESTSPKAPSRTISSNKNQIVPEFRVGIRLRPMLEEERNDTENNEELVYLFPQNNILCIREPGSDRLPEIDDGPPPPPGTIAPSMGPYISTHPFNYVFGRSNTQEEVYFQSVHPLVEHFLGGKNSLILAYGQMGSGKTYTIGFQPEDYNLENFQPESVGKELGFVPRAFQEIFSYMHLLKSQGCGCNLLVTFIAISCEDIADLLGESITRYKRPPSPGPKMSSPNDKRTPTTQPKTITVHDRGKQGTYLKGAKYERVESMERLAELLYRGTTFRRIVFGPDSENLSHAILSFHLEQDNPKKSKEKIYSKLNFVDLSCTEKIDKVEARMNRMECGVNDKSWLALSKVINLLTANRPKGYIPYRDSKLTQVLQDSLSGDAIVLFLSCLTPTACDENKSVLKYMIRSTNIDQRNTVVPPKLLKSIIFNLESMLNTSPTSPTNKSSLSLMANIGTKSNSLNRITSINSSLSRMANTNSLSRITTSTNQNGYGSPALANTSTTLNLQTPVNSDSGDTSFTRNQNLENINTSLILTNSILYNNSETLSPIASAFEEDMKRKSNTFANLGATTKNSIERPSRRPVNRANMMMDETTSPINNSPINNRTSQHSMRSVPSINTLHSSLVNEMKNNTNTTNNNNMAQMLEEQLKSLNTLSEETVTTPNLDNYSEVKGHRKKNSDGKKHISFHKRVLSFHKAVCHDITKNTKEGKGESDHDSAVNSAPIPLPQTDENVNGHIAIMLNEIKNTIGDNINMSNLEGDRLMKGKPNSINNLDQLVYYLKVLLQDYSKNQDEVKKLTAIINNSDLVNNSNNPLRAVVGDVENLKFIENLGMTVPAPQQVSTSKSSSIDLKNLANITPPPNHPPPPLPTESSMVTYGKSNTKIKI